MTNLEHDIKVVRIGEVPEEVVSHQFCEFHILTPENPEGTDCAIKIEHRRDRELGAKACKCPYASLQDASMGLGVGGLLANQICADVEPRGVESNK